METLFWIVLVLVTGIGTINIFFAFEIYLINRKRRKIMAVAYNNLGTPANQNMLIASLSKLSEVHHDTMNVIRRYSYFRDIIGPIGSSEERRDAFYSPLVRVSKDQKKIRQTIKFFPQKSPSV